MYKLNLTISSLTIPDNPRFSCKFQANF